MNRFLSDRCSALLSRFRVDDLSVTAPQLEDWIKSPAGGYLLRKQRQILQEHYANLPGYHLMHLGLTADSQVLDCFQHLHPFSLYPRCSVNQAAITAYDELPLPSEIVDTAILQHALEFSAQPKAVLSEVSRVIAPGGHLILSLLDPFGPMGLAKLPMQLVSRKPQFRFHYIRSGRLIDWLSLLGFQVNGVHFGAFHFPRRSNPWVEQDSSWEKFCEKIRLPLGNFYMIHAVKRVMRGISQAQPQLKIAVNNGYNRPAQSLSSPARLRDVSRNSISQSSSSRNNK